MRRANFTLAWIVIATLFLAGCGGNEGQQRAAFVEFLQVRILDKPGIRVPKLTDAERSEFGRYADHYAVITDFNGTMDEGVSPKLQAAMSAGAIRSLSDVVTRRADLQGARAGINEMGSALSGALAQADAAHAKLEQPADLKIVYDKAYDRLVTQPASVFRDIVPLMNKVLGEAVALGQYIEGQGARVRINGPMIETSDPAIQSAINDKLQSLQSNQQAVQSAQSRMQSLVYGGSR